MLGAGTEKTSLPQPPPLPKGTTPPDLATSPASAEKPAKEKNAGTNGAAAGAVKPAPPSTKLKSDKAKDETQEAAGTGKSARRSARRRPAGPVRERLAANDDVPSIGGLIYALQQKPSLEAFKYAGIASTVWLALGFGFGWLSYSGEIAGGIPLGELLSKPTTFIFLTAIVVPVVVIWFLAVLAWRAEELRLRSSTMTEVAVRLAEPDRMAEQSVASLGQAVRRQVSFMNDAVSRALGRAGELEALVHNEVAALEHSYEENEQKIRGLIRELANERSALVGTGDAFAANLKSMSEQVPTLIENLSGQQTRLAGIIQSAGDNLTSLETSIESSVDKLEGTLGSRTEQLQTVLEDHTGNLDAALSSRTDQMRDLLGEYTAGLADALTSRTQQIESAFREHMDTIDASIGERTDNLQTVFEAYGRALDATLANRAEAMDAQLIERTRALDDAFSQRLMLFDDSIKRSTDAIDVAVGERASALTTALDSHSKTFRDTITQQASDLDESLVHGINAVRRSSENITRQSLKAIEGLAGQSDMLKNVSENLLGQINSLTNRFDTQSQSIMQAANSLEAANHKVDNTLRNRHSELTLTLDKLSGTADNFSQVIEDYSTTIEGSLADAEKRARAAAQQLRIEAQSQQKAVLADFDKLRADADAQSSRALEDLRQRFATVQSEVSDQLGSISSQVQGSTDDLRVRTRNAAAAIAKEQARLQQELAAVPAATRQGTESMRRALQDQLRALEKLSDISAAHARENDVRAPVRDGSLHGGPLLDGGVESLSSSNDGLGLGAAASSSAHAVSRSSETARGLSSLSSSVAQELEARRTGAGAQGVGGAAGQNVGNGGADPLVGAPGAPGAQGYSGAPAGGATPTADNRGGIGGGARAPGPAPGGAAPAGGGGSREGWSLGDLLERASFDEGGDPPPASAGQPSGGTSSQIDIARLAQMVSPSLAGQIWQRLRAGQRGFLNTEMYSPDGQRLFGELERSYRSDPGMKKAAHTVINEFETSLRHAEAQRMSSDQILSRLTSDVGRVYLVLAHLTGRLG